MRVLYGRHFSSRYKAVSAHIPRKSKIVDVCSGDCYLYTRFLRDKSVDYLGLDINPILNYARKQGVNVRKFDLWNDPVPKSDIVVIQASLYHFIPHDRVILNRLLDAAREKVIVAESIRNLSASRFPLIAELSKKLSSPGGQVNEPKYLGERFDRESLLRLFASFDELQSYDEIPGGRELVGVFSGRAG